MPPEKKFGFKIFCNVSNSFVALPEKALLPKEAQKSDSGKQAKIRKCWMTRCGCPINIDLQTNINLETKFDFLARYYYASC